MFWRYVRSLNAFNMFVIVYYNTLGTAFAAILKHLFYLETGVYLQYPVWKIGPDGVKRRKGSLASGKTISSQNLIHTGIELG